MKNFVIFQKHFTRFTKNDENMNKSSSTASEFLFLLSDELNKFKSKEGPVKFTIQRKFNAPVIYQ